MLKLFIYNIKKLSLKKIKLYLKRNNIILLKKYYQYNKVQLCSQWIRYKLLSKILDIKPNKINIKFDIYGKPYVYNYNIYFNISHSYNYLVIVISNHNVGVDIEKINYNKNLSNIIKHYFNSYENYIINNESYNTMINLFYRLWVVKESYFKYNSYGLSKCNLKKFNFFYLNNIWINKFNHNQKLYQLKNYYISIFHDKKEKLDIFFTDKKIRKKIQLIYNN